MSLPILSVITLIFIALRTIYTIPKFVSIAQISEILHEI